MSSDWAPSSCRRNLPGKLKKSAGAPCWTCWGWTSHCWLPASSHCRHFSIMRQSILYSVRNGLTSFENALLSSCSQGRNVFTLAVLSSLPVPDLGEPVQPQIQGTWKDISWFICLSLKWEVGVSNTPAPPRWAQITPDPSRQCALQLVRFCGTGNWT